jgi:hypothetical protein
MGAGNSVWVQTEKPTYIGGEVVQGTIHLNMMRPERSDGLFVILKGQEKCSWDHTTTRTRSVSDGNGGTRTETYTHTERVFGRNVFYKMRIPVYHFAGGEVPAGQWSFPFSFPLPTGLPQSFREVGRNRARAEAKVEYKVIAELHVQGFLKSNVRHKTYLVVNEPPPPATYAPVAEIETPATVCCCFNKGPVWLRARLDRDAYMPGDESQIVVEVDNRSKANVKAISSRLRRRLTLRSLGGRVFVDESTIAHHEFPGVPKRSSAMGDAARFVPLRLVRDDGQMLSPQTYGQIVTCEYWIEVRCRISWGSAAAVDVPVRVYAPPTAAPVVAPLPSPTPDWHPQAMAPVALAMSPQYAMA